MAMNESPARRKRRNVGRLAAANTPPAARDVAGDFHMQRQIPQGAIPAPLIDIKSRRRVTRAWRGCGKAFVAP